MNNEISLSKFLAGCAIGGAWTFLILYIIKPELFDWLFY